MIAETTPIELVKYPKEGTTFLIQKRTVTAGSKKSSRLLISFDFKSSAHRKVSPKRLKEIGQHLIDQAKLFEEKHS
jgi:hypothetical protein